MYTECPDCHTYFKITPEQLKAAEGKVRCGSCNHVFNALTNLAEKVPPAKPQTTETEEFVEVDDNPESVVAFQVDDPESEAALSEISLPLNAESLRLADSDSPGDKDGLSLESMADLSAIVEEADEVASQAILEGESRAELSEVDLANIDTPASAGKTADVSSVNTELSSVSEVSSVKTELSGFSELLSTPLDVEADTPAAASGFEASELQSHLSQISAIDKKETKEDSGTVSFADVDVPGVESEVVSSLDNSLAANLEDINKDIDDALDNLFDDDELTLEKPEVTEDPLLNEEHISDIDNLSGLDDLDDLEFEKKQPKKASKTDISELDLSDGFDDRPAGNATAAKPVSEFDLDDSFLNSEPLKGEETEWEPLERPVIDKDIYAGENFKLEELQEDKPKQSGGASKIVWILVIGLLFVVLLGQFAYLKREELAKYPSVRPVLEQVCAILNSVVSCQVPDPRDLKAIVVVDRNVVSHPNAKNALLITSTVKNEANFTQQFPELVLTFSDINQKVLARRIFKPMEYLAKGVDIGSGMQPNLPVKIMLEIVDPGEEAVNFEFDFR